jgi:predicted MPP superfamily phosphohydrolase
MRWLTLAGAGLAAGAAVTGYAVAEAHRFQVVRTTVPCMPAGRGPLRILHLSDLHAGPKQRGKLAFLEGLRAQVDPDLVVVTGDFLGGRGSVPAVLGALAPLLSVPGAFVLGSNDYYEPRQVNPLHYLRGPSTVRPERPLLPWGDLVGGLRAAGWLDLSNAGADLGVRGLRLALRGVDDPHIGRDDYARVAGPFSPEADLRIGVAHAPYLRILDAFVADGTDLVLAGHTHGGQICLPGGNAIVTNCDLDPGRASGLSRHDVGQVRASSASNGALLHVSAGVGTAPSAQIRLFCQPRADVLDLVAA